MHNNYNTYIHIYILNFTYDIIYHLAGIELNILQSIESSKSYFISLFESLVRNHPFEIDSLSVTTQEHSTPGSCDSQATATTLSPGHDNGDRRTFDSETPSVSNISSDRVTTSTSYHVQGPSGETPVLVVIRGVWLLDAGIVDNY